MLSYCVRMPRGGATLILNRPDKLNALSKHMFEALEEHVDDMVRETRAVGLVVLRGAQANFSAGYDMHEVHQYVRSHTKPHYDSEVGGGRAGRPRPGGAAGRGRGAAGALE